GSATLTVADARRDGLDLDIAFVPPVAADRPFAALRSMYVTDEQADVADVTTRSGSGEAAIRPILDLGKESVTEAPFRRVTTSGHNLSAPDYDFRDFFR